MELANVLPFVVFGLGVLSRVFVPWLAARRKDPSLGWSWRYIWPQLLSAVIVGLVLPLVVDLASVATLALPAAYLAGWGSGDLGRTVDKIIKPPGFAATK